MRKGVVGLVAVVVIALGAVLAVRSRTYRGAIPPSPLSPATSPKRDVVQLSVGRATIVAEFARTPEEWEHGLGGRTTLPQDAGMLFLFPSPEPKTLWMKNTLIPLDLIWIRESRVRGVTRDVQPEPGTPDAQLRRYPSPGPVDQVLEVNAGWATQHGVMVGDHAGLN